MSAHEGSAAQAQDQWNEKAREAALKARDAQHAKVMNEIAGMQGEAPAGIEASDALNEELQAMRSVARQIDKLPGDTQSRVVAWLTSRYAQGRYEGPLGIGGLRAR